MWLFSIYILVDIEDGGAYNLFILENFLPGCGGFKKLFSLCYHVVPQDGGKPSELQRSDVSQ